MNDEPVVDWRGFRFSDSIAVDRRTKEFLELLMAARCTLVPPPEVDAVLTELIASGQIASLEKTLGWRLRRVSGLSATQYQEMVAKTEKKRQAYRRYFGEDQPIDVLADLLGRGLGVSIGRKSRTQQAGRQRKGVKG